MKEREKSIYATNIFNRSLSSHTSASISQAKSESHEIDSDERPLTFLKYNRDGDLLFSYAKDHNPTVWFADNGERLGTYCGHNGAVWCCDVSGKSSQSTNKLTLLPFFSFCDKKILNYFDLVSTGDSMILITRSKRVGSLNLIGLSFLISNADFAVWFLRKKKIEKRSN